MPWVTIDDVASEVGVPSTSDPWLSDCVDAANDWCYRRRALTGRYIDDPDVVPNASVKTGTILFAADQYRRRGATDGSATYDAWPPPPSATGSLGNVYRLLGISSPVVA